MHSSPDEKVSTHRHWENRLFPRKSRQFMGQRWLNIILRSLHLVGIAGVSGGFLFTLEIAQWKIFWLLALVTGITLSLIYLWSNALWLFQLKGVAIITKLVLLGIAFVQPAWRAELFVVIILISAIIAHAPGKVRGYLLFMRHRQDDMKC
ncbi:MAG TPA: hypothetical protein ENJ84_11220 [Gammaproteobacteria bacterium]|nr:hypothetical protein [Gammaproteobacteria bacterium]